MRTKLIALIIIGVIISAGVGYLYDQMYDCFFPPMWMKIPRSYSLGDCLQMYADGTLPDWTKAREDHAEKQARNMELIEHYKDTPEVIAFYAKYDDANVSVGEDFVSYSAGNVDDFRVRMNQYFDENHEPDYIDFFCYVGGEFKHEVPQEDILHYLQNYDCEKKLVQGQLEPVPEPVRTTENEMNLRDARQKLGEIYHLNSSFGPFNIKDVIVGYGIADGVLVVDVLTEYYESDQLDLIKQKIRDIVGSKVTIEFSPSGAIVPTSIESVFPYVWNSFLHQNGIEFIPKEQSYANTDVGYDPDFEYRVCSPIIAKNGTEFYISSTFIKEPFEITGTFIDKTMPDDCFKIWKTDTILVEPDRILMLWLENYHSRNE